MKIFLSALLCIGCVSQASALVINEVMSNPTGDDSGREWIELYNDSPDDVDLASMTISIKGGNPIVATPLQGGTLLGANSYAIVGSTVSGATKFLQDYPNYSGMFFKSSISLVNTGVTSIDVKVNGVTVASLPSYTGAKEGFTLSYVGGSYVLGTPTPGADNQVADTSTNTTSTSTNNQVTLPQATPPSANIVIYMPEEKVVVAGAPSDLSVFSLTRDGKTINDLLYMWAFGDGGQGVGSTTRHRYEYSGRYIAQVQAQNAEVSGTGRMTIRVVPPEISIVSVGTGKHGAYVDIKNPSTYELDMSGWMLNIDGSSYPFPKNTLLPADSTTRFSGTAMGFASTTVSTSTVARIMFPDLEEVTRYVPESLVAVVASTSTPSIAPIKKVVFIPKPKMVLGVSTTTKVAEPTTTPKLVTKDTRLVSWFRKLFR